MLGWQSQWCVGQWPHPTPEAALSELLRGRGVYENTSADNALAPYQVGRVSLPASVEHIPAFSEIVGALGLFYLAGDGERMRLKETGVNEARRSNNVRPYSDPKLLRHRKSYRGLNKDLDFHHVAGRPRLHNHVHLKHCTRTGEPHAWKVQ